MQRVLFILILSFYSSVAFASSCLDLLVESPRFELTSTLVVGPALVNDFNRSYVGSLYLNPRVYLSPYDEEVNHVSIGITPEKNLYLVHSKSRRDLNELSTGWLLSGELKIDSFEITTFGFLSVVSSDGKVYTIDNKLAEKSLIGANQFSMKVLLFGKSMPESGLLKEVESVDHSILNRLDLNLFLNHTESD